MTRALLGLAAALAVAGCAGTAPSPDADGGTSTSPAGSATATAPSEQRIEVEVAGGQVTGDTGRVPVTLGAAVTLVVAADVDDQIHVHGYDRTADVSPGAPAEVEFDATIPGVFEVELHDAGTVLLTLQVR